MSDLRGAIIGYGLAGSVFHAPLISSTPGLAVATVVTGNPGRREQALRDHPGARVVSTPDELWRLRGRARFRRDRGTERRPRAACRARPRCRAGGRRRQAARAERGGGGGARRARAREREAADGVSEPALGLRPPHAAQAARRRARWATSCATSRASSAGGRSRGRMRGARPPAPGQGGGVLLDLGSHLVDQALQLFGPVTHVYAEIDNRRGVGRRRRRVPGAATPLRHLQPPVDVGARRRARAAPARARNARRLRRRRRSTDRRTRCGPAGARTIPTRGASSRESRWGRLVKGEESEPVPSEPGAWPAFYTELERALREGGPPPVDPADAVATLEVIDAARRSAAERQITEP